MKKVFSILCALALTACVTVTASPDGKGRTETNQRRERNYELGIPREAVVGDPLVRVRDFIETVTEVDSMEPSESFTLTGGVVSIHFRAGERLPIYGQRVNDGITYTVVRKDWYGVQIGPDGTIAPGVINSLGTGTEVVMVYRFQPSSTTARFSRTTARDVQRTATGSNFEIVFNGIDGQAMRFQYREYTADDMARPAFFQDLSYPLNSRTIRFRSMEIAVASVDAQRITYTVVAE